LDSAIDRALTKKFQQFRALNTSKHGSTTFAQFYESATVSLDNELSGWLPFDLRVQMWFVPHGPLSDDAKKQSVQDDCNALFRCNFMMIADKDVTSVFRDTHTMPYLDGCQPDCTFSVPNWPPSPLSVVLLGELTVHDFSPGMPSFWHERAFITFIIMNRFDFQVLSCSCSINIWLCSNTFVQSS
jgi:hypothetical protein